MTALRLALSMPEVLPYFLAWGILAVVGAGMLWRGLRG